MTEARSMWEVMVPTHDNDGQKFPVSHHQEWDKTVQYIAGGQTLHGVVRCRWIDEATGAKYEESMIPVRIACTSEQIDEIGVHTKRHYGQIAVLAYCISNDVRLY